LRVERATKGEQREHRGRDEKNGDPEAACEGMIEDQRLQQRRAR
jgi:hypothetical protein